MTDPRPCLETMPDFQGELEYQTNRKRNRFWNCSSSILIAGGLTLCGFMLARSFTLLEHPESGRFDLCSVVFAADCDATLGSQQAWLLGIPLAGWGAVYFVALASLLFLGRMLGEEFRGEARTAALLLATAGACAGLAMLGMMLIGGTPFCPLCAAVHGINFALVGTLKRSMGRSLRQLWSSVSAAGRYVMGRDDSRAGAPATVHAVPWKVAGFANVVLVAVVVYQWVFVEAALRREHAGRAIDPDRIVAAYEALPRQNLPVDEDDPRLGPADAPVRMVVFASFQCPGCRRLAAELPQFTERFGDKLAVIFKHYPLSTTCNARMQVDKHPHSCEAAWAAEAARRQGQFWPFHNALFRTRLDDWPHTRDTLVRRLGLDPQAFRADFSSAAVRKKVAEDVALGTKLQIASTPAVFLDGRPVRSPRPDILAILIAHELEQLEADGPAGPAADVRPVIQP